MKLVALLTFFISVSADAAILNGGSTLIESLSGPNQLIVTGEPAKALYLQLDAVPEQDPSAFNKVMRKSANQMSCSFYVDAAEYGCDIFVSAHGIVQ